jgi:hypothetical protein
VCAGRRTELRGVRYKDMDSRIWRDPLADDDCAVDVFEDVAGLNSKLYRGYHLCAYNDVDTDRICGYTKY